MAEHQLTGVKGEKLAYKYIIQNGFKILHTNWRFKHLEVDIIATKNNKLHFIEVKTRRSSKYGHPEEDVNKKKLTNLIDAAEEFTIQFPEWKFLSFDILSIKLLKDSPPEFFYIEDVYL